MLKISDELFQKCAVYIRQPTQCFDPNNLNMRLSRPPWPSFATLGKRKLIRENMWLGWSALLADVVRPNLGIHE